jgi:uncharacterized cupin superfamily protein
LGTELPEIRNFHELSEEGAGYPDPQPGENFRLRRRLTKGTAVHSLGSNYCRLPPGHISARFHYHTVNDELIVILEGTPILRYGSEEKQLRPGDVVTLPASGAPHQFRNDSDSDSFYIEISSQSQSDRVYCPEHGYFKRSDHTRETIS